VKPLTLIHSIKPKQSQSKIYNAIPLIKYLQNKEEVLDALPQAQSQIFYIAGPIELGGMLSGVDVMKEVAYFNFRDYVIEGSPEDLDNTANGILLGSGLAKKMSLKIGDNVQVSTISGEIFPLKIVGIYQSGLAEIDNVQSFTNLKTIQKILGKPNNHITHIKVKLKDIELAYPLSKEIESLYDVKAVDIKTANAQFDTGTSIRNIITYAVSIALLIVAGFGIYNILNMLIYEKMNDIAILKAVGFSGLDVQIIFLSQALIIGIAGGLLGLLLGFLLSLGISYVPFETSSLPNVKTYPVDFDATKYFIGMAFALVSTFFAGFFPSKKAKNIDPVRIITGQ
jgi:lipoprotein-releasing system permease protein